MTPRSNRNPMMSETLAETWHSQIASVPQAVTRLRRRLAVATAGALALSVVLASAMPVRADSDDDLVAALAALAVIGIIISESDDDEDVKPVDRYDDDRPGLYPYPAHNIRIPAVCAIEVEGRDHREVVFYAESCLRKYGVYHLPNACSREVKIYGRRDWVYGEPCLRKAGYRFDSDVYRNHERPD